MKKNISKLLIFCCLLSSFSSLAKTRNYVEQLQDSSLLNTLRKEMMMNQDSFLPKEETDQRLFLQDKEEMLKAKNEILEKLQDDSINILSIKKDLNKQLQENMKSQIIEFKYVLKSLPETRIQEIISALTNHRFYSADMQLELMLAYTVKEKEKILLKYLTQDLQNLTSQSSKKIGYLTRSDLIKEIKSSESFLNSKNEKLKTALIIVASVAVAGLATWGILSATKKRHEKRMADLEVSHKQRLDQAEKDYLQNLLDAERDHQQASDQDSTDHQNSMQFQQDHYSGKMVELQASFDERARLRDQGYVWTVCSVTEKQKTVTCPYNFETYIGVEVCSSRCIKNLTTGDVYSQESLICTSASIPDNCYKTNPYTLGFSAGDVDGYNSGYDSSFNEHYKRAFDLAYDSAYFEGQGHGDSDGYSDGFNAGYSAGLSDGQYDSDATYSEGYQDGYDDGYTYGYNSY